MSTTIKINIDGKLIEAQKGQTIVEAARANGIYIPTLCNYEGLKPKGCCRMCTIKINNRFMTACTTPVADGMEIDSNTGEINDIRKGIIEVLFVSGNHFCPSCEKSGNCDLQALGYRYRMMVPRFPYTFPQKGVDASSPVIIKDQNRCIMCKRCIKSIKDENGRAFFGFNKRGHKLEVILDPEIGKTMSRELAMKAMETCPVGSILCKEVGYVDPIGTRKYDKTPIGSEIE